MKTRNIAVLFVCLILTVTIAPALASKKAASPDHLVIMVFDQMRPDYIDRFDLKNFKRLRKMGTDYPNAYVGHLAAETLVSHLVISSGLLPKELPFQDQIFPDAKGLLGKPGANYFTSGMKEDQLFTLMRTIPKERFLQYRLKEKSGGSIFTIGEKDYAAVAFGTPSSDSIITFKKSEGKCMPSGVNVPAYVTANERYTVDCKKDYGTARSLYPLDGDHYAPGNDPKHQGGDVWVADVALEVMQKEKWSGLFLTFGAIDKFGHMLGEQDGERPRNFETPYSFEQILQIADAQLGRILDSLEKQNLLNHTMIIAVADHGGEGASEYLGNGKKSLSGNVENEHPPEQPFWIDQLLKSGNVTTNYEGTAIRLWLNDTSLQNKQNLVRSMSTIPGVVEIYDLQNDEGTWHYKRDYSALNKQPEKFQRWAAQHNLELVNTMAAPTAPQLVGLLADGVGFAVLGDHGGAQEKGQRIPFITYVPGQQPHIDQKPIRLVDIASLVSKIMAF